MEFLEARIAEQEAGLQGRGFAKSSNIELAGSDSIGVPPALREALLAECAAKRRIVAEWKATAEAEGIDDLADAEGSVALARRSMLIILAAEYKDHADYQEEWSIHK